MDTKDISLRDYFAAKAMQAFISGHQMHYGHEQHWAYNEIASVAYEMADEMLKEREKSSPKDEQAAAKEQT